MDRSYNVVLVRDERSETMQSVDRMPLYKSPNRQAAIDQYDRLRALVIDQTNDLTQDERRTLYEDCIEIKDYLTWIGGHSDLSAIDKDGNKYDNYFMFIIPGSGEEPDPDILKRERALIKKQSIEYDLIKYYRLSKRMFRKRLKIYVTLHHVSVRLHTLFKMNPKGARLAFTLDSGEKVIFSRDDLKILDKGMDVFLLEFNYIHKARSIRSPYGSKHPLNLRARYKRIILSEDCLDWLAEEPILMNLRNYVSDETGAYFLTWSGRGMITVKALETLIRLTFVGRGVTYKDENGYTRVKYKVTDMMTKKLGIEGYIDNFHVRRFMKTLLGEPIKKYQVAFLEGEYSDEKLGLFMAEMNMINEYADIIYENVIDQKEAEKKAEAVKKAARERLKKRQEIQLAAIRKRKNR